MPRLTARLAVAAALLAAVPALHAQSYPKGGDPRDDLAHGMGNAGVAIQGMRHLGLAPKAPAFDSTRGLTFVNSDLAFRGNLVYQGNFAGFVIWDVRDAAKPVMVAEVPCITAQGDPSIIGNLLFISAEGTGNRNDCATGGVKTPDEGMQGVRIYDVSNPKAPRLVKNVQTCKGSHTHTVVPHPTDKNIVYLYVSGNAGVRQGMAGCVAGTDPADEGNALYRLDVIKVPVHHPEMAEVVTGARIFTGIGPTARRGGRPAAAMGPRNCHDVTAYPAMGLLAGACASAGLLVDISNPEKPVRLDAVSDTNFSLWHTAVFSNDGKKVVFTDEWGGGTQPMCQKTSMMEMGGNTTLVIGADRKMKQHAYFKIPTAQTDRENCVSHNGSLIPVPGRDVMVQGWYQGGVNLIDFTDPDKPYEIGFFDRGPVDAPRAADDTTRRRGGTIAGSWGAYWYNGRIYSSEMARGLDILELVPTAHLSANEIAAAKLVMMDEFNPQSQPLITWPAAFPVVRSYVDQLERGNGLAAGRIAAIRAALDKAEAANGAARRTALTTLAGQIDGDVAGARDAERVKTLAAEVRRLAGK